MDTKRMNVIWLSHVYIVHYYILHLSVSVLKVYN